MRACGDLLENSGLIGGVQTDREEDRLGAVRGERGEHRRGVLGPWAVVEGEHHLSLAQEVVGLEVLETETGPTGGVDLDRAEDPERVRIARAGGACARRRGRRGGRRGRGGGGGGGGGG